MNNNFTPTAPISAIVVRPAGQPALMTVLLYGWALGVKRWLLLDVPADPAAGRRTVEDAFNRAKEGFPQIAWDALQHAFPGAQPGWQDDLKGRTLTATELAPRCSAELAQEILSEANSYSHGVRVFQAADEDARHPHCPQCGAHNFKVPMLRVHNCEDSDDALFLIDLDEDGPHMTPSVGIEEVEFNTRGFILVLDCRECGAHIGLEIRIARSGTEFYWHSRYPAAGEE